MFWKQVSVYILPPMIHKKVNFHSPASLTLISLFKFASQKADNISLLHLLCSLLIRLLIRLSYLYNSLTICISSFVNCLFISFAYFFFQKSPIALFSLTALYTTNTIFLHHIHYRYFIFIKLVYGIFCSIWVFNFYVFDILNNFSGFYFRLRKVFTISRSFWFFNNFTLLFHRCSIWNYLWNNCSNILALLFSNCWLITPKLFIKKSSFFPANFNVTFTICLFPIYTLF